MKKMIPFLLVVGAVSQGVAMNRGWQLPGAAYRTSPVVTPALEEAGADTEQADQAQAAVNPERQAFLAKHAFFQQQLESLSNDNCEGGVVLESVGKTLDELEEAGQAFTATAPEKAEFINGMVMQCRLVLRLLGNLETDSEEEVGSDEEKERLQRNLDDLCAATNSLLANAPEEDRQKAAAALAEAQKALDDSDSEWETDEDDN